MQGGLANLAIVVVFTILFMTLLTQRMMLSPETLNMTISPLFQRITDNSTSPNEEPANSAAAPSATATTNFSKGSISELLKEKTKKPISTLSANIKFQDSARPSKISDHSTSPVIITPMKTSATSTPLQTKQASDRIHFKDSAPTPVVRNTPKNIDQMHDETGGMFKNLPSPRAGTDIGPQQHSSLIQCVNQSQCIVLELQLQRKYKIYLCSRPVRFGIRFYFLTKDGLLMHPNVELLHNKVDMPRADYIIYLPGSAPWHKSECNDTSLAPRLLVLDEFDGHTLFAPTMNSSQYAATYGRVDAQWYYMYFKRSFVRRHDGRFQGYPHLKRPDLYPMTYALAEAYLPHRFNSMREIEISCTLRGSKQMPTRQRVSDWVAEYRDVRGVENVIKTQLNHGGRGEINQKYFEMMRNTQIIVTVNPAYWEGDFRLWEAMGSGALIFVDPLFVPHQFPLIDGEHVVYFSNANKTDLWAKLDFYRSHPVEARRVAVSGYLHAMKYHRTVNLIDYILRSTHLKELTFGTTTTAAVPKDQLPGYTYTGQYLNSEARIQEAMIKECHAPGIYEDPLLRSSNGTVTVAVRRMECDTKKMKGGGGGVRRSSPGSNIAFSHNP